MYNALKVKWIYWAHQFQRGLKCKVDILGSSVSEGFETKNEIHKMVFFLFLSVTLHTSVSIDRSNILYLFTFFIALVLVGICVMIMIL